MRFGSYLAILVSTTTLLAGVAGAATRPRARDLGVPFDGTPGPLNAITDVAGVTVGHATLVEGENVRTGVTAVLPRGEASAGDPVYAGWYSLNGNGELTGTAWIEESGFLEGPVICYEWKGGIGSASRVVTHAVGTLTVGVLVQANFGLRDQLLIAGVPVGREIPEDRLWSRETGSIIVVVATDAPLLPHQLERLARRVPLGLARTGSVSGNGSGDLFLAFSTANAGATRGRGKVTVDTIVNDALDGLFAAVVQATEEAIVNALVAAEDMTGRSGTVRALPHDRLQQVLRRFGRL